VGGSRPHLFRLHPRLEGRVAWTRLGELPTPVAPLPRLGAHAGHGNLWVKRDDLSSPLYGGNKVRKLEFTLADALRRRRRTVITFGALGSNHVLATTVHGRRLGLSTAGVLVPQPVQEYLRRNVLCDQAAGCRIEYVPARAGLPGRALRLTLAVPRPYLLWMGGSSRLGVLGYVEAGLEIGAQVEAGLMPEPEYAFVPAGTGGTAAGLILGLALAGLRTRAVAVRVLERTLVNEHVIALMARRAHALLARLDPTVPPVRVEPGHVLMLHGHAGSEYARFTAAGQRAVALARELEGLRLEGTYSGKALAGMMAFLRDSVRRAAPVLFIDTHNSAPLAPLMSGGAGPEALPAPVREYFSRPVADVEQG
jgi:D-cysteine desulfhydrase